MFRNKIIYPKKGLFELREDVKKRIEEINKDFNVEKAHNISDTDSNLEIFIEFFLHIGLILLFLDMVFLGIYIIGRPYNFFSYKPSLYLTIGLGSCLLISGILKVIEICYYKKNWHYIDELNELLDKKGLTDLKSGFYKLNLNDMESSNYFIDKNIKDLATFEKLEELKDIQTTFPEKEFCFSLKVDDDDYNDFFEYFKDCEDEDEDCWHEYTLMLTPYIDGIEFNKIKFTCNRREFKELIKDKDSIDFSYLNSIIEKIEKDS